MTIKILIDNFSDAIELATGCNAVYGEGGLGDKGFIEFETKEDAKNFRKRYGR